MLLINQLKINTDKFADNEVNESAIVRKALSDKIKTDPGLISDFKIISNLGTGI